MVQTQRQADYPLVLDKIGSMLTDMLDQIPIVQSGINALTCIQRGIQEEPQEYFDEGLLFTVNALDQELKKLYRMVDDCWFLAANPTLICK